MGGDLSPQGQFSAVRSRTFTKEAGVWAEESQEAKEILPSYGQVNRRTNNQSKVVHLYLYPSLFLLTSVADPVHFFRIRFLKYGSGCVSG